METNSPGPIEETVTEQFLSKEYLDSMPDGTVKCVFVKGENLRDFKITKKGDELYVRFYPKDNREILLFVDAVADKSFSVRTNYIFGKRIVTSIAYTKCKIV